MELGARSLDPDVGIDPLRLGGREVAPAVVVDPLAGNVGCPVAPLLTSLCGHLLVPEGPETRIDGSALEGEAVFHNDVDGAAEGIEAVGRIVTHHDDVG